MSVEYTVKAIWGDYAVLLTDDGIENRLALALLPPEVCEGDRILCDGLEYTIKK